MKKSVIFDIVNQQDIVVLNKTTSVHDAVQTMSSHRIAAIAIVDNDDKLVGIATEGDMTHRVLGCGLNPQATNVSDVMTENPVTLCLSDDTRDAIELMLKCNFRHIPVIGEDGHVIAMVSMRDILRTMTKDLDAASDKALDAAFTPS